MRTKLLSALLAILLLPLAAAAQEDEGMQDGPQWWVVIQETVPPHMAEHYEEVTRKMIDRMHATEGIEGVEFITLSGPEAGYMYAVPTAGFADWEKMGGAWSAMLDKVGREDWMAMADEADRAVEHREMTFYVERADLAYDPEEPRFAEGEAPMVHYDFLYVLPGKEDEFEALAGEFAALYAEHGVPDAWSFYQAVTGDDLPLYVVGTPAASTADYHARGDELDAMMGDADDALRQRSREFMRKFEHFDAWVRPDLSYPGPDAGAMEMEGGGD